MNRDAMKKLGENAKVYAKAYVEVKEALMREGVPEKEAIESARMAAQIAAESEDDGWPL